MEEVKTMYQAVPAVSELNSVRGFDPLRYIRRTKEGPKLDLSVKKLWFRMKYPNGRIKLSHLKITEQLAIIEARVYFDKNDKEAVSNYTAQRYKDNSPGGLYSEHLLRQLYVASGMKEIAEELDVSLSTVQKELKLIMAICIGVADRLNRP